MTGGQKRGKRKRPPRSAYGPNEDPIERVWLDLYANVACHHGQATIDTLLDRVQGRLAERFDAERRSVKVEELATGLS